MRRQENKKYKVFIQHASVPDAEQRISSAFSLIFGTLDLSPEGISNITPTRGKKDEKPAIEKTIYEQD
jgi:hypothetical protein